MRLLIGLLFFIVCIGIAVSVPLDNSTEKGIVQNITVMKPNIANISDQTNESINQINITNQMNNSNKTNIFVISKSTINGNRLFDRPGMQTPSQSAFKFGVGVGISNSAMETPSQSAFGSSPVI
jgi:hypothetical protein